MKEAGKGRIKDRFIQAMQKDPYFVGVIANIKVIGLDMLTDYGTLIIRYYNPKTGILAIIDPAKPTMFIKEDKEPQGFNIHIPLAIQLMIETFGTPEIIEIPKFHTNINITPEMLDPKNIP
jgi:hypothetical protein